jgi:hypothetical protein
LKNVTFLKNRSLIVINFVGLGWVGFVWGMVGAMNLRSNWVEFFIELRFNCLTSYLVLDFVHVGFVLRG